jgi:hypothetical protein
VLQPLPFISRARSYHLRHDSVTRLAERSGVPTEAASPLNAQPLISSVTKVPFTADANVC